MVPSIPFDLFGDGQSIRLTIGKFMAIEQMLKKPISEVLNLQRALDLTSLTVILSVGIQSADGKIKTKSPQWYAERIQELLEDGHEMDEIMIPVIKAIAASGIMGHSAYLAVCPDATTEDEEEKAAAEKN